MATMITSDCINCGACEPECPNNAISQGEGIYVIDPLLCTECVGFHDYEACAAVCPVDCCVTDPNNVETEAALIARARALHPEVQFPEDGFESRFRKSAPKETSQPAAAKAPPAAEQARAPAEKAPPRPASAPAAAAKPAPAKTEEPAARPAVAAPKAPRVVKEFPGQLPVAFDELMTRAVKTKPTHCLADLLIVVMQPVLGALPDQKKRALESAVGNSRVFSRAAASGLNLLLNFFLYAFAFMALAVGLHGVDILFDQKINGFILLGVLIAFAESVYRLRDGIFKAKQPGEMSFAAAFYGFALTGLANVLIGKRRPVLRRPPIPVDGFYDGAFVEKLERERRYGNVYSLQDLGDSYYLQVEFPKRVPQIGPPINEKLPEEMPDYDYELLLKNGTFIVKGRCTDERIRRVSSSLGAFPPEFTTVINLKEKVSGFSHRYENKLLEVLLVKDKSGSQGNRF
ncbi:MAG TPA: YfhL family 4Fe-4S dicluster ferredoxin [Candidatus Acidoferrales bacterium]|nr:YfhL family 4Fe-4S dicluster ferredoxin [Candidatus Acidoferrales bacterium]